jgi:hypothetical protein
VSAGATLTSDKLLLQVVEQLVTEKVVVKAQDVTCFCPSVRSSAIATAAAASRAVSPDMPAHLSTQHTHDHLCNMPHCCRSKLVEPGRHMRPCLLSAK